MAAGLIALLTPWSVRAAQTEPADPVAAQATTEATRTVLLDLRMRGDVLGEDYAAAASTLSLMREIAPDDTTLIRRAIEAAFSGGDTALMESLTRELVRLDPKDTVAQLRLISQVIGRSQTVEERAAAYERFLGPSGNRLDPSVRSRLALDAALLQRELGNSEGFVRLLSQATSLDATNKSAASLAAQYFSTRVDDPMGRLELQVNLLYADPVDPNVHAAISRELLAEGAYTQARRFFQNSAVVAQTLGRNDENLAIKQLELQYLIDDPAVVADALQTRLAGMKIETQRRLDYLISRDLPTTDVPDPEKVRLPRQLEFLRLLAADAAGREQQRRDALDGLTLTIGGEIESLYTQGASTSNMQARAEFIRQLVSEFMQLQIARLMLNMDADKVEQDLTVLATKLDGVEPVRKALEPWIALAHDDPQRALDLMKDIDPSAIGDLCTGIALSMLGEKRAAVDRLIESGARLTNPAMSAWARRLALDTGGADMVITARGREMAAFVDRVPVWIDRMMSDPSTFMILRVEPTAPSVAAGGEAMLRVRLENIAPVPLGLGADRTISSRMLISPSLDQNAPGFVGKAQPEVMEMDQRLRLKPGEGVEMIVPADVGYTGWLIGSNAHVTVREKWRVLQDFWIGPSGAIEAGAVALTANTDSVRRSASSLTRLTTPELTKKIEQSTGEELSEILAAVRTLMMHPEFKDRRDAGTEELVAALAGRYARATTAERVLMLARLPQRAQSGGMIGFDASVLQSADAEPSDAVRAMVLLTRVTDPESALLVSAAGSSREELAALAEVLHARLAEKRTTFATAGPKFEDLAGMTPSRFVQDQP